MSRHALTLATLIEPEAERPEAATAFDPAPRRIAVFRALHLGDLLCAMPALRALRRAAPQAHIALIGLPWARGFVSRFSRYVDELIEFPGYPGFPERPGSSMQLNAFLRRMRQRQFDLALQLHGTGWEVNDIVLGCGAARCGGFHPPGQPAPTQWFMPWPEQAPEIRRYLALMSHLGAAEQGEQLEFPLEQDDRQQARAVQQELGLEPGAYLCLHAGARLRSRRWPARRFAQVAEYLAGHGWTVLLTGDAGEAPLTAELRAQLAPTLRGRVHDLAGRTGLGGLAALLAQARLLLSNDTGLSHIAAALGTPSVIVSSGGDARRWAPLDQRRHRVLWRDAPCRPCAHEACPIGHPCALAVEPAEVIEAVKTVLRDTELPHE
jgi:ADP-heptose:LPS heptosyltransferase